MLSPLCLLACWVPLELIAHASRFLPLLSLLFLLDLVHYISRVASGGVLWGYTLQPRRMRLCNIIQVLVEKLLSVVSILGFPRLLYLYPALLLLWRSVQLIAWLCRAPPLWAWWGLCIRNWPCCLAIMILCLWCGRRVFYNALVMCKGTNHPPNGKLTCLYCLSSCGLGLAPHWSQWNFVVVEGAV